MEQEDRKDGRFENGTEGVIGALIEVHRALTRASRLPKTVLVAFVCKIGPQSSPPSVG
jgi:hypothetical protein